MRLQRVRIVGAATLGVLIAWGAFAQAPAKAKSTAKATKSTTTKPAASRPIATVGGLEIPRAEFDARFSEVEQRYRAKLGVAIPDPERPPIRRQVLEMMIRQRLVMLDAAKRPGTVSVAEAEQQMQRDPAFQTNGRYDPERWAAFRASPEYQRILPEARAEIAARRLSEQILRESQPDPAEARRRQERKLTAVLVDYLPLRRPQFDGSYPEPTEAQVIAYYKANAATTPSWKRPEELRLRIFHVDDPPIGEEATVRTDLREAWEQLMLTRADSVIAAIRGGASFENAAIAFGGGRDVRVPRGGTPPPPWRGNASDVTMLWNAPVGTVVTKAFAADFGRLVVRVDAHRPPGPAPLSEVAMEIRERLRRDARAHGDDAVLRDLYAAQRDSLKGPAARVRYAAFDSTRMSVPPPSDADIDRFYRSHLADYSSYDAATGNVNAQPLAQVRGDVVARWTNERKVVQMREAAEQVLDGWIAKKRNRDAEKRVTFLREVGPIPVYARVDTGLAGLVLSDSLHVTGMMPGAGMIPYPRGVVVFEVYDPVRDQLPTFEQARPLLEKKLGEVRAREEMAGARAMYDRDPMRFRMPRTVHSVRMFVPLEEPEDVPLTRTQVERWYRSHISDYSAEELVRASHILITPRDASTTAIEEARRKADALARRARAGEDFAKLARENSDDAVTRDQGGDVGMFRRGMMLDNFERIAYSMKVGEISDPVRTEVGWHVIECTEHHASEATPLNHCYGNVGYDCAQALAKERCRLRADSLRRKLKSVEQARAYGAKNQLEVLHDHLVPKDFQYPPLPLADYFGKLAKVEPGAFHPDVVFYSGSGWAVTWVDSISPERPGSWEQVRDRASEVWRSEGSYRANAAKAAELDSMGRAGWSLDSLGTLWGGLENQQFEGPGQMLPQMGGVGVVDSLTLGTATRPAALAVGQQSGWIELPGGFAKVRLRDRQAAPAIQLEARVTADLQTGLERNLRARYAKLQAEYPVRILDPDLAETKLPEPTEP